MAETEPKIYLTVDQAVPFLPAGPRIHTYRDGGMALIGADWDRQDVLDFLKKAAVIEVTGPGAQGMGHGLGVWERKGDYSSVVYVETVKRTDGRGDATL